MAPFSIGRRNRKQNLDEDPIIVESPKAPSLPNIYSTPSLPELAGKYGHPIQPTQTNERTQAAGGAGGGGGKAKVATSKKSFHYPSSLRSGMSSPDGERPPTTFVSEDGHATGTGGTGGKGIGGIRRPQTANNTYNLVEMGVRAAASEPGHGGSASVPNSQRPSTEYLGGSHESGSIAAMYSRRSFAARDPNRLSMMKGPSFLADGDAPPVPDLPGSGSGSARAPRSQRQAPTFTLMVVGDSQTGKTSFVRTLLGTVKVIGGEGKNRVDSFGLGLPPPPGASTSIAVVSSGTVAGTSTSTPAAVAEASADEATSPTNPTSTSMSTPPQPTSTSTRSRSSSAARPSKVVLPDEPFSAYASSFAWGGFRNRAGRGGGSSLIEKISVEVVNNNNNNGGNDERTALTVIDTKGLGMSEGADDLDVEGSVNGIMKLAEGRFEETLKQENQVYRQSSRPQDTFIHLCLYFIRPESIQIRPIAQPPKFSFSRGDTTHQQQQRKQKASLVSAAGGGVKSASSPALNTLVKDSSTGNSGTDDVNGDKEEKEKKEKKPQIDETADTQEADSSQPSTEPAPTTTTNGPPAPAPPVPSLPPMSMSPVDLRVIKRLSTRMNVLPVISRADELTDSRLDEVKVAISKDLAREGLGFGVFSQGRDMKEIIGEGERDGHGPLSDGGGEVPSSSRDADGGGGGDEANEDEEDEAYGTEEEEEEGRSRPKPIKVIRTRSRSISRRGGGSQGQENGIGIGIETASKRKKRKSIFGMIANDEEIPRFEHLLPFALISPENPWAAKGEEQQQPGGSSRFVRRFRWGNVDVLNEAHCDFTPLRDLVLGPYMRTLKDSTRQDKYEPFRTQKLLVRRATRNMSTADRQALLKALST